MDSDVSASCDWNFDHWKNFAPICESTKTKNNVLDCLLSLVGTMNRLAPRRGARSSSALWVIKPWPNTSICCRGYHHKTLGFRPALAQRPSASRQLSPLSKVPILKPEDWRRSTLGRAPPVYPNINSLSVAGTILPSLSNEQPNALHTLIPSFIKTPQW